MEKLPFQSPGSSCFLCKMTDERFTALQTLFFAPSSLVGKLLLCKDLLPHTDTDFAVFLPCCSDSILMLQFVPLLAISIFGGLLQLQHWPHL